MKYIDYKYPIPTSLSRTRSLHKKGKIGKWKARTGYLYYIHWYTYGILDKTSLIIRKLKESPSAIPSLQHRRSDIASLTETVFVIIKGIRLIGRRMTACKAFKLKQELRLIHNILDSYLDTYFDSKI